MLQFDDIFIDQELQASSPTTESKPWEAHLSYRERPIGQRRATRLPLLTEVNAFMLKNWSLLSTDSCKIEEITSAASSSLLLLHVI